MSLHNKRPRPVIAHQTGALIRLAKGEPMGDHSSHQHPAHQPPDPLAPLRGQFPRWEAWRGIGGLLYARLRKSSPPVVFRDVTGEGLAAQIREWENSRR